MDNRQARAAAGLLRLATSYYAGQIGVVAAGQRQAIPATIRNSLCLGLPSSRAAVEVALKAGDLIELLAALGPGATLRLGVTGPQAPVLAAEGNAYRHVLMPLRRA